MRKGLFLAAMLTSPLAEAEKPQVLFHEGIERCVGLVDDINDLDVAGNTPVEKYIAGLTKELRVREYKQNCVNVTTPSEIADEHCNDANAFCQTLEVMPVRELVL